MEVFYGPYKDVLTIWLYDGHAVKFLVGVCSCSNPGVLFLCCFGVYTRLGEFLNEFL